MTTTDTAEVRLDRLEVMADRLERMVRAAEAMHRTDDLDLQAMRAGVAVERSIATTGRCLCGRRPTIRERIRELILIARHV